MDKLELQSQAEYYKYLYQTNKCTREQAKENIQPYLDFVNSKSKELCKKYNQRYKEVGFAYYMRT